MKGMLALLAIALIPSFSFAQASQYRGPEYESLFNPSLTTIRSSAIPGNNSTPNAAIPTSGGSMGFVGDGEFQGFNRWEFWFEINKDVLLRSRYAERQEVLGAEASSLLGLGRMTADDVVDQLFPALEPALSAKDPAVRLAALRALGKCGLEGAVGDFDKALHGADRVAQKQALLGLGLTGDRVALKTLTDWMTNRDADLELRAYAALGLGLSGAPETLAILKQFLEKQLHPNACGGPERNLTVAAVAALAMPRDWAVIPFLVEKYNALAAGESRTRAVRCAILAALGRIDDTAALGTLSGAMKEKDIEIRRAAALALGDVTDTGSAGALVDALLHDPDLQTRGFSAISLGRMGGDVAKKALRKALADKKWPAIQAYTALALGLAGDRDDAVLLRAILEKESSQGFRSAAALGLGFLKDTDAVKPILKAFEDRKLTAAYRGYAAIALGLIRPDGGLNRLLAVLRSDDAKQEELARGLVLGVGLFRDPAASEDLLRVLAEHKSGQARGNAALAIGMTRDPKALKNLGELVAGKVKGARPGSDLYACIALGTLGDRHNYPLLSEVFFNSNYRLRVEIVDDLARLY